MAKLDSITPVINTKELIRFFSKIALSLDRMYNGSACWEWQASLNHAGYGRYSILHIGILAHRYSYWVFVEALKSGAEIDHLCKNPRCCNPAHLEAVSRLINIRRSDSISGRKSRQTHCKRGHPFDELNTHITKGKYGPLRQCKACGLMHQRRRAITHREVIRAQRRARYRRNRMKDQSG